MSGCSPCNCVLFVDGIACGGCSLWSPVHKRCTGRACEHHNGGRCVDCEIIVRRSGSTKWQREKQLGHLAKAEELMKAAMVMAESRKDVGSMIVVTNGMAGVYRWRKKTDVKKRWLYAGEQPN